MFPIINQACFTGANHHQHHKRTFRNGVIGRHCHLSRHSPCPQFHERTHRACPRHRAHLAQASCRRHTPESKRHDGAGREAREPSAESGPARPLCRYRRSPRLRPLRPRRREAPCVSLSLSLARSAPVSIVCEFRRTSRLDAATARPCAWEGRHPPPAGPRLPQGAWCQQGPVPDGRPSWPSR